MFLKTCVCNVHEWWEQAPTGVYGGEHRATLYYSNSRNSGLPAAFVALLLVVLKKVWLLKKIAGASAVIACRAFTYTKFYASNYVLGHVDREEMDTQVGKYFSNGGVYCLMGTDTECVLVPLCDQSPPAVFVQHLQGSRSAAPVPARPAEGQHICKLPAGWQVHFTLAGPAAEEPGDSTSHRPQAYLPGEPSFPVAPRHQHPGWQGKVTTKPRRQWEPSLLKAAVVLASFARMWFASARCYLGRHWMWHPAKQEYEGRLTGCTVSF